MALTPTRSNLDWRWIGIGAAIMVGLSFVASLLLLPLLGDGIVGRGPDGSPAIDRSALGGGRLAIASVLSFLSFAVGGYIVGRRSPGKTVLEAGIAAAIAVAIGLLLGGGLTIGNLLAGALVPFLAGLLGAWLGERSQRASSAL